MYSLKNIILKHTKNYMSKLLSVYVRSLNDWLNVFYFSDYYYYFEITVLKSIYTLAILAIVYLNMNYYIVLDISFHLSNIKDWSFNIIITNIWNNGLLNFIKNLFFNSTNNNQRAFNVYKEVKKKNFKVNRDN